VLDGKEVLHALNALPVRLPSQQSELSGVASFLALKGAVGVFVAGAIGRVYRASSVSFNMARVGLGGLAAALVGGDDPRERSRALAYRPLRKVRIVSAKLQ
jgi:hypothetical protein